MCYKIPLKILVFSLLMLVVVAQITPSIASNSLVGFIAYFCFTIYCIKKFGKKQSILGVLLTIIAVRFIIDFYGIYLYFSESISALPYLVIHLSAIASGLLYLRLKKPLNMLPFLLAAFFTVFMFFQGWHYWLHKANFGTFTGRVEAYRLPAAFDVIDEKKNLITANDFQNKIVILDFWHTRCGACFMKFPQLQALHEKYQNDSSVAIFAIDKPIEEDKPNQAFEMIRERGYSFPVVIAKDENLPENFGVQVYPTTFVIDRKGMIVFKGDIEGAVRMVGELRSDAR